LSSKAECSADFSECFPAVSDSRFPYAQAPIFKRNLPAYIAAMTRALTLLIALYAFWLLLSGFFTPFLLAAGLGSSIAVLLFAQRMAAIGGKDGSAGGIRCFAFLAYCPWLIKEIVIAAIDVAKRILDPRLPISPTLVEFAPLQTGEVALVIHANSITLTPGTISVEVEPGRFLVHALSSEAGAGLAGSEMDKRCAALERH
jgi:multicomponent Na+:H+ antiporter subunit E